MFPLESSLFFFVWALDSFPVMLGVSSQLCALCNATASIPILLLGFSWKFWSHDKAFYNNILNYKVKIKLPNGNTPVYLFHILFPWSVPDLFHNQYMQLCNVMESTLVKQLEPTRMFLEAEDRSVNKVKSPSS